MARVSRRITLGQRAGRLGSPLPSVLRSLPQVAIGEFWSGLRAGNGSAWAEVAIQEGEGSPHRDRAAHDLHTRALVARRTPGTTLPGTPSRICRASVAMRATAIQYTYDTSVMRHAHSKKL